MSLTKCVNGVHVPLTEEEQAVIEAEWAASAAAPKPPRQLSTQELAEILKAKGVLSDADLT